MGFLGCTKVYTGLHISALSEMLSRQLSQTKFITHVSGAFPINPGHKQHRSPTVCQQYVDILHFQQLQPIICLCGEEIQMLLDWTPLCPHPYISREVNMKKDVEQNCCKHKTTGKSNGCIRVPLQFKSNCSGFSNS